jgi:hypothetical protein
MARTQPRGNQLKAGSLANAIIATNADIALSKLHDGALIALKNVTGQLAVANGTDPGQAVNLGQLTDATSAAAGGLDGKESCRLAFAVPVDVATGGLLTQGAVTLLDGQRVLLFGQTLPEQNGIYLAHAGAWTRAADADSNADVTSGLYTFVEEGTYAGFGYMLAAPNPIALGTTPLTFNKFTGLSQVTAGQGLEKSGDEIRVSNLGITGGMLADSVAGAGLSHNVSGPLDVNVDGSTVEISSDAIRVKDGGISAAKLAAGVAGAGLVQHATTLELDVNVDGSTIEISSDAIRVKDLGVSKAKINSDVAGAGLEKATGGELAVKIDATGSTALTAGVDGLKLVLPTDVMTTAKVVTREPAAGTIDGVNVTFTLAYVPVVGSECVFLNGFLMDEGSGNDYTIDYSSKTVTFGDAPETGDKLRVNYIVA